MGVNSYLEDLAKRAIVGGDEKARIQTSISNIVTLLKSYFKEYKDKYSDTFRECFIFGSYKRGTIIPRKFDDNSDVDLMVVFEGDPHDRDNPKPKTYLNYLKDFAESKYPRSISRQSYPAVVLELNHIKFDLVPALKMSSECYKIPDPGKDREYSSWRYTNPNDLDGVLSNQQTLRRLVRVAKIWNVKQGRIYDSYELEKWIVEQCFWGNLAQYFYSFCEYLPIKLDSLPQSERKKIERLQERAQKAKRHDQEEYLKDLFE
ncbi:SMODS domain-containing nucleotidyltransferase [Helicobacter mehlei]|uniref:Nucleotidyltransferase n=1 Tax=Helicobacter mehlei TaxID=2316080 RepID=A0A553V2B2_9HELI|nr:nucleotidyltransferase domain-containing protein [Helicobacter mehlei]TSA86605.1 nucleotidyltransferase [Helicobacter mehlei]